MANVRLIKHEEKAIPGCGSFEVRFGDGRPPVYFYCEDLPSRRLRSDLIDRESALVQAQAFARAAGERVGS